jgi:Glyoxalase/Bleomycin resistance protein/Dioxygenase superfamily
MKKDTIAPLSSVAVLVLGAFGFSQSSTATKPPEFDHAALHVHDLQKSAEFYEKVMGLARTPDPFKDGPTRLVSHRRARATSHHR